MVAVPAPASEPVSTSISTSTSASTRTSISTSTSTSVPVPVVVLVLVPAFCLANGVAPRRNDDETKTHCDETSLPGLPLVQHVDANPDYHVQTMARAMIARPQVIAGPKAPSHEVKFFKAKVVVMIGKVTIMWMMEAFGTVTVIWMMEAFGTMLMDGKVTVGTMVTEETIPVLRATPST